MKNYFAKLRSGFERIDDTDYLVSGVNSVGNGSITRLSLIVGPPRSIQGPFVTTKYYTFDPYDLAYDAVAEHLRLGHVVGRKNDAVPAILRVADELEYGAAGHDVEAEGGLV